MTGKILTTTIYGIEPIQIEVEARQVEGKVRFTIVGLPDSSLKEAKERVKCALSSCGFPFPQGEVIVSLSPASIPKMGSSFDLPIALAILASSGTFIGLDLDQYLCLGELNLNGEVKGVGGVFSASVVAKQSNKTLILPESVVKENSLLDRSQILPVRDLRDAIECIVNNHKGSPYTSFNSQNKQEQSLGDIIGQAGGKRALEITAAGGHNLLLVGPPGSGKSMLASRLPTIMPQLNLHDAIEVSKIHSAYSKFSADSNTFTIVPPFRSPHHTTSSAGLIGGGSNPVPGEISLAHKGVLFLDEFTELRREAIEALREPIETKKITISRANSKFTFPADFILIAAMNPCPCGFHGSNKCTCAPIQVQRYRSKISGPILDRFDLKVWVNPIKGEEFANMKIIDTTNEVLERVQRAREIQTKRFGKVKLNSQMSSKDLKQYLNITKDAKELLISASQKFSLSTRAISRVAKVARTIGDLNGIEEIGEKEINEVLAFRM